jgi:hypothetical protein
MNKYLNNVLEYYKIASSKTKKDINTLLLKCKDGNLSQKEVDRLKRYSFRYKMIIEANHINTMSRLNKLERKSLTTPNSNKI